MAQLTLDVEGVLTHIIVDPITKRLTLAGYIREVGGSGALRSFQEDVTDSLTAGQQATLEALVTKAETWLAAKTA